MVWRLFSTRTSVTIESGLTTLELHITTVPVEHQANSTTYYKESTQCNEIMVCVCVDIEQVVQLIETCLWRIGNYFLHSHLYSNYLTWKTNDS